MSLICRDPNQGERRLNVVVKGEIELRASFAKIKIKLGLEGFSFFWILLIYIFGVSILSDVFTNTEFDSYFSLFLFLIAYPLVGTYLIRRRMKRAEKELDKLFA